MKPARARAFTLAELLVVAGVVALMVVLLSPLPWRTKGHAQRTRCASQLAEIGLAFRTWAAERTNSFPMQVSAAKGGTRDLVGTSLVFPNFQVLSNELRSPIVLVCPADRRTAAKEFAGLSNANLSYFVGLDAQEQNPNAFLAGDRNVTNGTPLPPSRILILTTNGVVGWTHELHDCLGNVVLADGSVQQLTSSSLRKLNAEAGAANRLVIP
jgi:hypothetical protein